MAQIPIDVIAKMKRLGFTKSDHCWRRAMTRSEAFAYNGETAYDKDHSAMVITFDELPAKQMWDASYGDIDSDGCGKDWESLLRWLDKFSATCKQL